MIKKVLRALKTVIPVFIAGILINGCYMPLQFDAEIEITRGGFYSMIFDGYIVKIPLYDDIRNKKIKPTEIREKAELYRKSLARDTSMSTVKYLQQGVFQVHWEKQGDILNSKFVTFFQRNENMLSVRYVKKDGTIIMAGRSASKTQRDQLSEIGLDTTGQIRVITDAKVVKHNATRVIKYPKRGPKFRMYVWKIENIYTPSPNLVISLN